MDPWSAIAKAVVYPIARAIADAYFDAHVRHTVCVEEIASELDKERASRFRDAVRADRMQPLPAAGGDPVQHGAAPGGGGDMRGNLREIAGRILTRGDGAAPQGLVDREP